jgi:hypothetical protein
LKRPTSLNTSYIFVSGKNIEGAQKEKDIGVTIDSEPTFESHICEKVNKATLYINLWSI